MTIKSIEQLEDMLSEPSEGVVHTLGRLEGDIIILGVGGKMGPSLARMARRAAPDKKVIGVDLFPSPMDRGRPGDQGLPGFGIETIKCNLLDPEQLAGLPDAPNVIFMVGMKFGSTGQEALTWAMNAFLPGMVAQKYSKSKILAFSTGNIYGLTPIALGGPLENDPPNPTGEYATSALGRERIFEHFSRTLGIPIAIIRLNYANELRYGVLVDVAQKVWAGETIDLTMGNANVIWQGDAISMTLQAFDHVASPPFVVNIA
ncbi:MAG TPA: NAD-dependent epimerase/dehydratase family protein, partial [Armatimonadota bacterium]|nr:NAD-dependent epimerase/dehydratase family protein [Armatimonadota bacterium]